MNCLRQGCRRGAVDRFPQRNGDFSNRMFRDCGRLQNQQYYGSSPLCPIQPSCSIPATVPEFDSILVLSYACIFIQVRGMVFGSVGQSEPPTKRGFWALYSQARMGPKTLQVHIRPPMRVDLGPFAAHSPSWSPRDHRPRGLCFSCQQRSWGPVVCHGDVVKCLSRRLFDENLAYYAGFLR